MDNLARPALKARKVFYIHGFDPSGSRRYYQIFRRESVRQARAGGITLEVGKVQHTPLRSDWQVRAKGGTTTAYTVLRWDDIVLKRMKRPLFVRVLDGLYAHWRALITGTHIRMGRIAWRPLIAVFYPLLWVVVLAGGAFWAGAKMAGVVTGGLPVLIAGMAAALGAVLLSGSFERWTRSYFIFDICSCLTRFAEGGMPQLEARLDAFAEEVRAALGEGYDEVLIVGHSNGAVLAPLVVHRLLGTLAGMPGKFSLLTLGQNIPYVTQFPKAAPIRQKLWDVARSADLYWADIAVNGDGLCFGMSDPLAHRHQAPPAEERISGPRTFMGAFAEQLSADRYRKLRLTPYHYHFQYLYAFDKPMVWDYFSLTCGPKGLAAFFDRQEPHRKTIKPAGASGLFTPPVPKGFQGLNSSTLRFFSGKGNLFDAFPRRHYRTLMALSRGLGRMRVLALQPELVQDITTREAHNYPKSHSMKTALSPLVGRSVFISNDAEWQRKRSMIDPGFAGGKVRNAFAPMREAADAMLLRLKAHEVGVPLLIDREMTHVTADVIFRTLFSRPITAEAAFGIYEAFARYQASAPFVQMVNFYEHIPKWLLSRNRRAEKAGADIRARLEPIISERLAQLRAGTAPDDLATAIMSAKDADGQTFSAAEMLDELSMFFLAGHETSAAALSWCFYLIGNAPDIARRLQEEADAAFADGPLEFAKMKQLVLTRDTFREALRLYPPVSFMTRTARTSVQMRGRAIPKGAEVILSPWFMQRHELIWEAPHSFDPDRWKSENGRARMRDSYIPFNTGPRVCPGASFALQESVIVIASIMRHFSVVHEGVPPEPYAQLTTRARDGIWLRLSLREDLNCP